MNERSRIGSALPSGLLAMIAVSAMVEFGIARRDLDWMSSDEWDWRATRKAAGSEASGQEILLFGDSQIKIGVLPTIVEKTTGRKTLGLAVGGGHAAGTYYLARRAFASGARPRAIVVDFLPHYLEASPFEFRRPWQDLLGVFDCIDMSVRYRDAEVAADLLVRKILPSMRYRAALRSGAIAALDGRFVPKSCETACVWRNLRINRGGMAWPVVRSYDGAFDPNNPVLFPKDWRAEATNLEYARRTLALARDHGARVYWLLPPIVPNAQKRRDLLEIEDHWDEFVNRLQNEFSNLVVLDARRSGYGVEAFWDPIHLNRLGSATLSADVGATIESVERGAKMSVARWISLPNDRPVAIEKTLEDLTQSLIAVQARAEGKRR